MKNNDIKVTDQNKKMKRTIEGTVVSVKNIHTVIIEMEYLYRHPLYKKSIRRTKRYAVHNESFALQVGDTVRIVETKPISKTKHFIVLEKI